MTGEARTQGLSPKLHGPIGVPLSAVVYRAIADGVFDRQSAALLALGLLAAGWSWLSGPGKVYFPDA